MNEGRYTVGLPARFGLVFILSVNTVFKKLNCYILNEQRIGIDMGLGLVVDDMLSMDYDRDLTESLEGLAVDATGIESDSDMI